MRGRLISDRSSVGAQRTTPILRCSGARPHAQSIKQIGVSRSHKKLFGVTFSREMFDDIHFVGVFAINMSCSIFHSSALSSAQFIRSRTCG